jgi:hypothetical protein
MTHQLCKHAEYVERPRTHVDDDRTEDTNTTVGDVHEHGEEEVAVCPWVDEGLSDLIPLPLVVSDTLGVGLDSVDGDGLLSITQPAHTKDIPSDWKRKRGTESDSRQLRVWKDEPVQDASDECKEAELRRKVSSYVCGRCMRLQGLTRMYSTLQEAMAGLTRPERP